MSLSFLVPLFLVGLAGIAVPIVVHLTRRQRRNVVAFPSLMFLRKIPYDERRRRRIQHWLLLALRAVALALLAFAFARPFFDNAERALGATAGPREVVVLLDRSYSMGIGTRFEDARAAARRAFEGLGPLDRASLVVFSGGANVLERSTSDGSALVRAVDTLTVGWGTTRYGPALKVAQTVLEESDLPAGEVVLVSDFQGIGWTGDEGVRLPPGATLTPVDVGTDGSLDNVQVADVTLSRQAASGRERVTAQARLVRVGGAGPREVEVTLSVEGRDVDTVTATVPASGAATATFQPFTLSRPHTRGTVRASGDALAADDLRNFVLSPGGGIGVVALEGAGTGRDASLYLSRALDVSDEGRFRVASARRDGVRPVDLRGASVLVLNEVRLDGASAERVRDFVREGGGVLLVAGESASWPASAADLLPGALGDNDDRAEGRGGRLGFLDYAHPVFERFAGPRSGDFTGARFLRTRAFVPADGASVLARFDDGSVALAERRTGRGTVLVWTSTFDVFWNDLPLQPVFLPFVHRLVEHASGLGERLPWFTVGQVLNVADPEALETAGLASPEAAGLAGGEAPVAIAPSGGTVALGDGDAGAGARYLPLDERGFYTIRPPAADPARPFVVAVNVDLEESHTGRLDPEELVARVSAPEAVAAEGPSFAGAAELQRADLERRQALWRFLLVAAFVLLGVETFLSNWVSRRPHGITGPVRG